jgi:hypothetical protein
MKALKFQRKPCDKRELCLQLLTIPLTRPSLQTPGTGQTERRWRSQPAGSCTKECKINSKLHASSQQTAFPNGPLPPPAHHAFSLPITIITLCTPNPLFGSLMSPVADDKAKLPLNPAAPSQHCQTTCRNEGERWRDR